MHFSHFIIDFRPSQTRSPVIVRGLCVNDYFVVVTLSGVDVNYFMKTSFDDRVEEFHLRCTWKFNLFSNYGKLKKVKIFVRKIPISYTVVRYK